MDAYAFMVGISEQMWMYDYYTHWKPSMIFLNKAAYYLIGASEKFENKNGTETLYGVKVALYDGGEDPEFFLGV